MNLYKLGSSKAKSKSNNSNSNYLIIFVFGKLFTNFSISFVIYIRILRLSYFYEKVNFEFVFESNGYLF